MIRKFPALPGMLALLLFMTLPGSAFSAEAAQNPIGIVGSIVQIEGDATIAQAAEPGVAHPVKPDDPVHIGDIMQTGPGGRMIVLLLDDSHFILGENSQFKIDQYAYNDEDSSDDIARYAMPQGAFRYVSGAMDQAKKPNVKIAVPFGSIGLRAATIWGGMLDNGYNVYVADGEATVESKRGRIHVLKDEATAVSNANAIPERAGIWGKESSVHADAMVALKNPVSVQDYITSHEKARKALIKTHKDMIQAQRVKNSDSRGESLREIRPLHQKPSPASEELPKKKEKAVPEIIPEQSNAVPPPMPDLAAPIQEQEKTELLHRKEEEDDGKKTPDPF
ncbi:MAG TPA: hypothetical protein VIF12_02005 [Micavibrio sp.]